MVPVGVDQEDVVITLRLQMLEEGRVILLVGPVVGILLGRFELVLLAFGIGVAVDVTGVHFLDGVVTEEAHGAGETVERLLGRETGRDRRHVEPDAIQIALGLVAAAVGRGLELLVDLVGQVAAFEIEVDRHGGAQRDESEKGCRERQLPGDAHIKGSAQNRMTASRACSQISVSKPLLQPHQPVDSRQISPRRGKKMPGMADHDRASGRVYWLSPCGDGR